MLLYHLWVFSWSIVYIFLSYAWRSFFLNPSLWMTHSGISSDRFRESIKVWGLWSSGHGNSNKNAGMWSCWQIMWTNSIETSLLPWLIQHLWTPMPTAGIDQICTLCFHEVQRHQIYSRYILRVQRIPEWGSVLKTQKVVLKLLYCEGGSLILTFSRKRCNIWVWVTGIHGGGMFSYEWRHIIFCLKACWWIFKLAHQDWISCIQASVAFI